MMIFFLSIQNKKQQMGDKKTPKEQSLKDFRELTEANHQG